MQYIVAIAVFVLESAFLLTEALIIIIKGRSHEHNQNQVG